MAARKLNPPVINDLDTRQRIILASIWLFGQKGYEGTSTRAIAELAKVNIASLNYHFQSKHNLLQEVTAYIINEFKSKIRNIRLEELTSAADYTLKVYQVLTEENSMCLGQFKIFLDAENFPGEMDPYPIGFEELSVYLSRELNPAVPKEERLWASNVIFTYLIHTAVMSSSNIGKRHIEKYLPKKADSIHTYIRNLVNALIRDLNFQFP